MKVYARIKSIVLEGDNVKVELDSVIMGKFTIPLKLEGRLPFQVGDWINVILEVEKEQ